LCRRIDLRKANRRVLEALIRAGALDTLGPNRASLMAWLDTALRLAEQHGDAHSRGQDDFFGLATEAVVPTPAQAQLPEWPERERLDAERDTLGLYLTGHPIREFEAELAAFTSGRIVDLIGAMEQGSKRDVVVAGLVVNLRRQAGKRAFITLDDRSARLEMPVFEEQYQRYRNLLVKDSLLVVQGALSFDDYSGGFRISAQKIMDLEQARETYARALCLEWPQEHAPALVGQLAQLLQPYRDGACPVLVQVRNQHASARLVLGEGWRVRPEAQLLVQLREWLGADSVQMIYTQNPSTLQVQTMARRPRRQIA
jgi:DNA polymerase-3 subunit alpha